MRIRKRRALGGSTERQQEEQHQQQQQDASGAVINSGGLYARAKSPNSSTSSYDLKIPPSCLFSQGLRGALLLGNSSRYANRPQRQPAAAAAPPGQYICEPATSGRISSQREVLMANPSVDASELLHTNAKCVDKSSSEELAPGATAGGERGCKKVRDDSVGSAGCKKNAHMARPSDHAVQVDGHSLVSFCGQKVLPLELILSSGSLPARVSKSTNNTEVRLLTNNVTQAYTGSSMSKVKEDQEEAAEGGQKSRSKALETQQALASPDSSREPDHELVSLVKRRKLKKKERSAIRHDVAWLLSRLKGHRRVRSAGQRQRSRVLARVAEVSNALAALGQLMPVVGEGHPSLELATNEAAANLSLEQIKDIVPNEGSDAAACRSVQEKKKKKKIIMKKVAKIDINCMETHASSSTNGEKIKGSTKKKKKTKMDQQLPAREDVAVELEIKAVKKRKREAKEQAVTVLERCKRRDGRDWQCREPVVKAGATYCEYHTLKIKENHARSAEKLETPQAGLSKGSKKRKGCMDGEECEAEEGEDDEGKSGGEQVVLRRRWRKKCKPCIRRLHEIQERALALPAGRDLKEERSVEGTPWGASSPETHEPPHIHELPECLLNTDPREWRSDFL